jgi:hypothetical protein
VLAEIGRRPIGEGQLGAVRDELGVVEVPSLEEGVSRFLDVD